MVMLRYKNYIFYINDKVKAGNRICSFPGAPAPHSPFYTHFFFLIPLCDTLVLHTFPSPLELIGAALFLQLHPCAPDWLPTAQQASLGLLSNQGQAGERQTPATFPSHFRIEQNLNGAIRKVVMKCMNWKKNLEYSKRLLHSYGSVYQMFQYRSTMQ